MVHDGGSFTTKASYDIMITIQHTDALGYDDPTQGYDLMSSIPASYMRSGVCFRCFFCMFFSWFRALCFVMADGESFSCKHLGVV